MPHATETQPPVTVGQPLTSPDPATVVATPAPASQPAGENLVKTRQKRGRVGQKPSQSKGKAPQVPKIEKLPLFEILRYCGTQVRVELDQETVANYMEAIKNGEKLPAVVVFRSGKKIWLADGFYRHLAHDWARKKEIECEVHEGTLQDAVLYAVGANARHGKPRTNADKHNAVKMVLANDEWAQWSDRKIARQCGVSPTFVGEVRRQLSTADSDSPRTYVRDGRVQQMDVGNIGKRRAEEAEEDQAAGPVQAPETGQLKVDEMPVASTNPAVITPAAMQEPSPNQSPLTVAPDNASPLTQTMEPESEIERAEQEQEPPLLPQPRIASDDECEAEFRTVARRWIKRGSAPEDIATAIKRVGAWVRKQPPKEPQTVRQPEQPAIQPEVTPKGAA